MCGMGYICVYFTIEYYVNIILFSLGIIMFFCGEIIIIISLCVFIYLYVKNSTSVQTITNKEWV